MDILSKSLSIKTPCTCSIFNRTTFKEVFKTYTYSLNTSLAKMNPSLTIGNKIHQLRISLGLTQKQFGKTLDKALTTIANWENGYRNPSNDILNYIISIYNLDKNYFTI